MKKRKLSGLILMLLLLSGLVLAGIFSSNYIQSAQFYNVTVLIEDSDKQVLITKEQVKNEVNQFLSKSTDSLALSLDAFLLETSIEALPYVKEAQVYWNMDSNLVVEVINKSVLAIAYGTKHNYFISKKMEVLEQPKGKWLDLPVITGTSDSMALSNAGRTLEKMSSIISQESVAQLEVVGNTMKLVPRAYQHIVKAHTDQRMEGELRKLAAYYAVHTEEELIDIKRIDLRYKNQVVTTSR
jgi:cell division septal protein FtsQ